MEWLNYHHLQYFWVVAKEGSIVRASEELRLAHPTISGQIHQLEEVLGEKLFARRGRNLVLTEAGRVAFRYADEIFSLGREFVDTLKGRASGRPLRLVVGRRRRAARVAGAPIPGAGLPARPAGPRRLPGGQVGRGVRRRAGASPRRRRDRRRPGRAPAVPVRAFSHPLGECGTSFFAAAQAGRVDEAASFPARSTGSRSCCRAPPRRFAARSSNGSIARGHPPAHRRRVRRQRAGQGRSAMEGMGVFAAPTVIEARGLAPVRGARRRPLEAVRQQFYALSVERKIKHPAVVAICKSARQDIFGQT